MFELFAIIVFCFIVVPTILCFVRSWILIALCVLLTGYGLAQYIANLPV